MIQRFCSFLLFKVLRWKAEVTIEMGDKYVIALAPHTSNFDFVLGILYSRAMGFRCDFLIKQEWFVWPFKHIMRKLGGIPVRRDKNSSLTDRLALEARRRKTFHLCVTPEGTRQKTQTWKKGFYFIALKARIPILLFAADYPTKTIHCTRCIMPDGNIDVQMSQIMEYYKKFTGRHPEKFTVENLSA